MIDTGEPEIIALVHIVQRPIVVHYEHTGTSQMFGETIIKIHLMIKIVSIFSIILTSQDKLAITIYWSP